MGDGNLTGSHPQTRNYKQLITAERAIVSLRESKKKLVSPETIYTDNKNNAEGRIYIFVIYIFVIYIMIIIRKMVSF